MDVGRAATTAGMLLVGCGNMGSALLRGIQVARAFEPAPIRVVEPSRFLRNKVSDLGIHCHEDISDVPDGFAPEIVLFAVKPQILPQALPDYRRFLPASFISVAAGISMQMLEKGLGEAAIARAMPNTPAAIREGSTVLFLNDRVDPPRAARVSQVLSSVGAVHVVDREELIDAATAISGSGPAYVFYFIESLAAAGEELGLRSDMALALARETVLGAATLATSQQEAPAELRARVTSPNGTTEAALRILMDENALGVLVSRAAKAAWRRSQELRSQ